MLHSGQIHLQNTVAEPDGTIRAITIVDSPGRGVIAWAGYLWPAAAQKNAAEIVIDDYRDRMIAGFSSWSDAWKYFEHMALFAPFVPELQSRVEALIASGANRAEPASDLST